MNKITIECPACGREDHIHPLASFHQCSYPDCGYEIDRDELEDIFLEFGEC